jgi:hypothetical protein
MGGLPGIVVYHPWQEGACTDTGRVEVLQQAGGASEDLASGCSKGAVDEATKRTALETVMDKDGDHSDTCVSCSTTSVV